LNGEATDCQRRILVVDDDASIREALAESLGDEGYRVVTATNGVEALTLLRPPGELRPCVILLDLMMPVMSGQEFYAEQQRDPALARIPIVGASSSPSRCGSRRCWACSTASVIEARAARQMKMGPAAPPWE
jgi:CheY-like chemotaxis protein